MFVVQNVIFGFSSLPEHLFYQVNGSDFSCVRKDNALVIESFDGEVKTQFLGIFNSFPAEHFYLHTKAKEVYLKLNVSGELDSLTVHRLTQWNEDIVYKEFSPKNVGNIILGPFLLEPGVRRYSFELSTRGKLVVNSAEWAVNDEAVTNKTVDLSITTFKKEQYVINNVNALLSYKPLEPFKFRAIVVDNGSTLEFNSFVKSDKLLLIPQANLGGTGGFMRGLAEAHSNQTDYILFMDDDILLSPEVVFRAIAIAQISQDKKAYGGMMLHFTKKDKLHEQGGRLPWEVNRFFTAINDGDYLCDINGNRHQYNNLYSEGNPDFSGWWFYMAEVKETPFLPNFFFKWDDICSSLYLQKNNIKLSVFPTVFVWHEDFSIKRHLFMTDYLSMKNEIHTFAFLGVPEKQMKISFKRTKQLIIRDILMWDYNRAAIRLKALQDSLKYEEMLSPDFVLYGHGDYPVKLGREFTPQMQGVTNDIDIYFERERALAPRGTKRYAKLALSVIRLMLPWKKKTLKNNKIPMLSMTNGNFSIVYPYAKYFLYNPDGNTGYYCEYSFRTMIQQLLELKKIMGKVEKEYPKMTRYMKETSFDKTYWEKIFNSK